MTASAGFEVWDYLEIHEVLNEFNLRFDAGDADGFADLFTEDGVLEARAGICRTHDERRRKVLDSTSRDIHRHFTTNIVIAPDPADPARARARSAFIYLDAPASGSVVRSFGTYEDVLVKRDGRWRFQHRLATSESPVSP